MRIALTGATGLLGRNLLFEILKQNLNTLEDLKILTLGRPQQDCPLADRLENIMAEDGLFYLGLTPQNSKEILEEIIKETIIPLSFDLTRDGLGLLEENFKILKAQKIDYFFHVAALTDFRSDQTVIEKLQEVNVKGTRRILELIKELNIGQFVYVGSAYSCGSKTGLVEPDYINLNEKFRNPYERSKLEAEVIVREFAKEHKLRVKVFRPSTICGRLIEKPIGAINKFDVFYAWGAFFLRLKFKQFNSIENIYEKPLEVPIRIHFNFESGLNIVPSDYAAKVMYQATINNWDGESFHLCNQRETPHKLYTDLILKSLGIKGYEFVPDEPKNKNPIETFYYKTVGKLFTPYAISEPIIFDLSNISDNLKENNLLCPEITSENLEKLIDFAKERHFNLFKER